MNVNPDVLRRMIFRFIVQVVSCTRLGSNKLVCVYCGNNVMIPGGVIKLVNLFSEHVFQADLSTPDVLVIHTGSFTSTI